MTAAAEKLELAYLAGAMDADGFFTMTKTRVRGSVTVCESVGLAQLQPTVPRLLQARFGGYIQHRKRPESHAGNWRPIYYWAATTKNAARCAAALRPFLKVKTAQADLILALRASKDLPREQRRTVRIGRSYANNPEVTAHREELWRQIKALNHNGVE